MKSDEYKQATDEKKADMLNSAYSTGAGATASKFAKDNGISGVKEATAISSDISIEAQSTLAVAKTMDGDTRKKWLDTPKNASNYWNATYDNKDANGTLTEDDKSLMKADNLAYKALAAKVNYRSGAEPAVIQAYKEYSLKQWKALADDNPLKAKLWELDKARADAGVSGRSDDKAKQKYISSSNSGKGGKGSSNISLPAISKASGEGQKFITIAKDKNAVPQVAKATPKARRTISVKRGVQL